MPLGWEAVIWRIQMVKPIVQDRKGEYRLKPTELLNRIYKIHLRFLAESDSVSLVWAPVFVIFLNRSPGTSGTTSVHTFTSLMYCGMTHSPTPRDASDYYCTHITIQITLLTSNYSLTLSNYNLNTPLTLSMQSPNSINGFSAYSVRFP
jgi:hypothetical protein